MANNNELKLTSSDTHFENILAYYMDDKTPEEVRLARLSETDKKLKKRWEAAFTMLLEFRSPEDAAKKLQDLFKISKATAYRDVQRCEMLFGSFKRFDREAWRYISIERKHKLYQNALKKGDLELAYKVDKEIDKLLGLHEEESAIDPEKMMSQDYDIVMSKKQERLIKQIFASGSVVNMNVDSTIDVDFEEIQKSEDDEEN